MNIYLDMKKSHFILLLLILLARNVQSQCNIAVFSSMFSEASALQQKGEFVDAKNLYEAAKIYACNQLQRDTTDRALEKLFEQINQLREQALYERERADLAKSKSDSLFQVADQARKGAAAALNRIYFYQDRFGLAYDKYNNKYGFIDKNNNIKIEFKYDEAKSFDPQGLAQVGKDLSARLTGDLDGKNLVQYLIDTLRHEFPLELRKSRLKKDTRAIDFSYSNLYFIPIKITQHRELRVLRINHSRITKIPNRIKKVPTLEYVQLKNNRIKKIQEDINTLKNLKSFELSNNKLKKLPKGIGGLYNLRVLNLNDNQLVELPEEIGDLKNLQWLSLKFNKLLALPEQITKLENLQFLDLTKNDLTSLPKNIINLKNLKKIDLSRNHFQTEELERLRKNMPWCEIMCANCKN